MGPVSDMFNNDRARKWRNAGDDEAKKRAVRKAAHGNTERPSKRR